MAEGVVEEYRLVFDLADAVGGVFLEQRLQDLSGLWAVLAKEVALLDILGSLTACQRLLSVGNMADEVEVVDLRHALLLFQCL